MNKKVTYATVHGEATEKADGIKESFAQSFFLEYPIDAVENFFSMLQKIPSPRREEVFARFCLTTSAFSESI